MEIEMNNQRFQEDLKKVVADESVPSMYFNGYIVSASPADGLIILKYNDEFLLKINGSHTALKSMAMKLLGVLAHVEIKTGNEILTIDEIQTKMQGDT